MEKRECPNVRLSVKNAFYKGNPGKRVSVLPIFHFPLKNLHIALIHDRDPLFNKRFDSVFESIGVQIKRLPPSTPQMNARMENFIRAIKTECLNKIIFTSERQLRLAVKEYLEYWNHDRPHAGLGGKMVKPYPQDMNAPVREVSFLGGLLHGYRREPMAA